MTLEEAIKQLVAEAVKEAFAKELSNHLEAIRAAHEPNRLLAEALAGGDSEELSELRRVNALAYLDASDTAKLLGIGQAQVYKLFRSGELPATRIGRRYITRREDIDQMISRGGPLVTELMSRSAKRRLA